jgi:hypothetical protein
MDIVFPKIYAHQRAVYDAVINDNGVGGDYVVKSKRQCGKSFIASLILIYFSLNKRDTVSMLIEPTLNQSRRMFKDITKMLEGSNIITNANQSLLTIDFINGSELIFKSAEQFDAIRGYSVSGILIIDEGAYIRDDVYEILFPVRDAHNAPMLIISTPLFCDGYFYRLYKSSNSTVFDWCKYDTSMFLSDEKLEQYRSTLSELKFRSEYLGQFITDGGYVFRNITNCVLSDSIVKGEPVVCGIDWAVGNDGDDTVLSLLDANANAVDFIRLNNMSPVEQIDTIVKTLNSRPTLKKVVVEQNSIGNVYFDMLKHKYSRHSIITKFNTTNESKRRIIEQLATAFQNENIHIQNDRELINQLQHYAVEKTAKGYTYNGQGAHDDYVMSLAMAYDALTAKNNYCVSFKK